MAIQINEKDAIGSSERDALHSLMGEMQLAESFPQDEFIRQMFIHVPEVCADVLSRIDRSVVAQVNSMTISVNPSLIPGKYVETAGGEVYPSTIEAVAGVTLTESLHFDNGSVYHPRFYPMDNALLGALDPYFSVEDSLTQGNHVTASFICAAGYVGSGDYNNKVETIKTIRAHTDWKLKASKGYAELMASRWKLDE